MACLDGRPGCPCPRCCTSGMRYCPRLSQTPITIGSPLHVIRTSCSLYTLTSPLVKMEMVPLSEVLPTHIRDVGKSSNESACAAFGERCGNGSLVTYLPLLVSLFDTPTRLVDHRRIGRPAWTRSASLKYFPSTPESYVIMIYFLPT